MLGNNLCCCTCHSTSGNYQCKCCEKPGYYTSGKIPHKCPVCNGEGKKPHSREDGEIRWEPCHACGGSGILWG